MSDIAIRVEHLSKQYKIGAAQQRYDTLRDQLVAGFKGLYHRNRQSNSNQNTIWVLRDISFEVKQGEVLGIIGHNGAGKSTLLKILSRITEPTGGQASIYGRVASLLEVGTGFHPELTGRENVYLNGVILGMSRAEIHHKFDEIVAFSGVEKFIDTPVKHYSSGMGVRLAFSVAAHLEPEILIIDEVLAVGDATFQRKCLGKMEEVARTGRTVLFVSHNMGAITNLCCSAMWLDYGEIRKSGDVAATTSAYLTSTSDTSACMSKHWNRSGTGEARITDACLLDLEGNERDAFMMGETIVVEFDIEFHRFLPSINLAVEIKRIEDGLSVLHSVNEDCGFNIDINNIGISRFRVEIQNCLLYPSSYTIMIWTGINNISTFDYVSNILNFTIYQGNISKRTFHFTNSRGIFYQHSLWSKIL